MISGSEFEPHGGCSDYSNKQIKVIHFPRKNKLFRKSICNSPLNIETAYRVTTIKPNIDFTTTAVKLSWKDGEFRMWEGRRES